jgi:hypothetical protein
MFMQRMAIALRRQEWTTILIEFVLVVVGVLFALELDKWKDTLAETAEEKRLLLAVLDDVRQDILDLENTKLGLESVTAFGATAISFLDSGDCANTCWSTLVAFFQASQWMDVQLNKATYEETRRAGLPRDAALRSLLARYYALNDQSAKIFSDLPRYRELVRSIIPAATQQHLWAECFKIEARHQYLIADCEAPAGDDRAREILDELRANPETRMSLNFWLSTVAVVNNTLDTQILGAQSVIRSLTGFVGDEK